MIRFHYYERSSGVFHASSVHTNANDPERALAFARANAPEGHEPMAGDFDVLSQKVDVSSGAVVDYQPPAPSADHEWDETAKRWMLSQRAQERAMRNATSLAEIRDLESRAVRALIEHALDDEGARDRLEALHKQITDLRAALLPES